MKVTLKDGRVVDLITLTPEDTDRLHEMLPQMTRETLRWSMAPYQREWVQHWLSSPTTTHLAAEHEGKIVGFTAIEAYAHPKRRGVGYLGTYFHRDYAASELPAATTRHLLEKAREQGLHKIDTGAVAEDTETLTLLDQLGFETEGRRREDFLGEDGAYHDIIITGKILGDTQHPKPKPSKHTARTN
jgi:RimJ/RimL family protein N-acetyltransferase